MKNSMTQDDILEMARRAGVTDGIELQHEIDTVMRFVLVWSILSVTVQR